MKKHEFVASSCFTYTTKEADKLIKHVAFKVHPNHAHYIDRMMADVDGELRVTFVTNKEQRSIRQNRLLWSLISDISDEINGSHTESELLALYTDFIKEANILTDYVATTPEIAEKLKEMYRAVVKMNDVKLENGKTISAYRLYRGSSQFDVDEMRRFIEVILRHAGELGIDTLDTRELRG